MLASIVGQERALRIVRESLANRRLHHALLFAGPAGVGKRATAMALAAALLCEAGGKDACGECNSCAQVGAESHPDLTVVEMPEKKKSVSIEQIRTLQRALARRALAGRRKVAIVDDANTLTSEAQNAFLKTLEEPPARSFLVIVSRSASALLPTVRSRCQQITFSPLPDADVTRLLIDRHQVEPDEAAELARYAEGSLGAALALRTEGLPEMEAQLRWLLRESAFGEYRAIQKAAEDTSPPTGLPLLLRVLRQRLRKAAAAGRAANLRLELESSRAAWQAARDLDRYANRSLTLEALWLRIARAVRG